MYNITHTEFLLGHKKGAQKIIKMIEEDFDSACEEYDIYACADGFAQWPDFIDQQNMVNK